MFSNFEKRDMLRIYYNLNRNSRLSGQQYFIQYPERRQPHENLFAKLDTNLLQFGSFNKSRNKYGRRIDLDEEENIINMVKY